jgi:hypothetical protein
MAQPVGLFTLEIHIDGVLRHVFEPAATAGAIEALQRAGAEQMAKFDNLIREVQETRTVVNSAKVLMADLAQRLRDAAGDEAAIAQLAQELDDMQSDLAGAIAANTPGEEPPTEPPADEV